MRPVKAVPGAAEMGEAQPGGMPAAVVPNEFRQKACTVLKQKQMQCRIKKRRYL
jgi:hypothetical protein